MTFETNRVVRTVQTYDDHTPCQHIFCGLQVGMFNPLSRATFRKLRVFSGERGESASYPGKFEAKTICSEKKTI